MLASGAATRRVAAIAVAAAGVAGVACSAEPKEDAGYVWRLPPGFPEPVVPADNPMSPAKVELGRRLFHDPRLSRTGTLSCATCHEPRRAFSDGRPRSAGATGEEHRRNAPSLANVAYLPSLTWANPGLRSLERQVVTPLFGERPVEHGLAGQDDALAMLLQDDADYARLVPLAFPGEDGAAPWTVVVRALAAFERTLLSGDSAFDRYLRGDDAALAPAARDGARLFFSARARCASCHGGLHLGGGWPGIDDDAHGLEVRRDEGLFEVTGRPEDRGRFRVPSLRNVALTAPYFHDGRAADLAAVPMGGVVPELPPVDGAPRCEPPGGVASRALTEQERGAIVAFLSSLSELASPPGAAASTPRAFLLRAASDGALAADDQGTRR